jgi:hypothetical protein
MALDLTGPISLAGNVAGQSIELEMGLDGNTEIDMSGGNRTLQGIARTYAGTRTVGNVTISFSQFRGKSLQSANTSVFQSLVSGSTNWIEGDQIIWNNISNPADPVPIVSAWTNTKSSSDLSGRAYEYYNTVSNINVAANVSTTINSYFYLANNIASYTPVNYSTPASVLNQELVRSMAKTTANYICTIGDGSTSNLGPAPTFTVTNTFSVVIRNLAVAANNRLAPSGFSTTIAASEGSGAWTGDAITAADAGTYYAAGTRWNTTNWVQPFLIKFNADNSVAWQKYYGQTTPNGDSYVNGLAWAPSSGDVHMVGGSTDNKGLLSQFSSLGALKLARTLTASSGTLDFNSVRIGTDSSIFVTGINFVSGATYPFIAKYSSLGALIWQRQLGQDFKIASFDNNGGLQTLGNPSNLVELALDSSNNAYFSVGYHTNAPFTKGVVIKYDTNGVLQWQKFIQPGPSYLSTYATTSSGIVAGNDGFVYVIGRFVSGIPAGGSVYSNPSNLSSDVIIIKISDSGGDGNYSALGSTISSIGQNLSVIDVVPSGFTESASTHTSASFTGFSVSNGGLTVSNVASGVGSGPSWSGTTRRS